MNTKVKLTCQHCGTKFKVKVGIDLFNYLEIIDVKCPGCGFKDQLTSFHWVKNGR